MAASQEFLGYRPQMRGTGCDCPISIPFDLKSAMEEVKGSGRSMAVNSRLEPIELPIVCRLGLTPSAKSCILFPSVNDGKRA